MPKRGGKKVSKPPKRKRGRYGQKQRPVKFKGEQEEGRRKSK